MVQNPKKLSQPVTRRSLLKGAGGVAWKPKVISTRARQAGGHVWTVDEEEAVMTRDEREE